MSSEGFAAVPNWMIRDSNLSIYALMVYTALASHSGRGGIFPSYEILASEARCSERKVGEALAELKAAGVIETVRRKSRAGRASNGYSLHPNGGVSSEVPAPGAETGGAVPAPDDSQVTAPHAEEEEPLKNEEEPAILFALESQDESAAPTDDFDAFWQAYPRHVGKVSAKRRFEGLARKTGPKRMVDGARRFAEEMRETDPRFIPHPTTWLNRGGWDDEPLPPLPTIGPPAPEPPPVENITTIRLAKEAEAQKAAWLARHGLTNAEYEEGKHNPLWLAQFEGPDSA